MNTFIKKMSRIIVLLLALLLLASCATKPEDHPPLLGQETVAEEKEEAVAEDQPSTRASNPAASTTVDKPGPFPVEAEKPSNSQADETVLPPVAVNEPKENKTNTNIPAASVTIQGLEGQPAVITDQSVAWESGDTVLDLLIRTTREQGVHLSYRGRGKTGYVEGINNLYEFDNGPASGWVYSVNGVFPDRSAGGWEVEEGDSIVWWYTLDAGRDVGVFSP